MGAGLVPPAVRHLLVQVAVLLLLSGSGFLMLGVVLAYSVLLGGLISIVPGAYFVRKVFAYSGARAMHNVVRSVYVGEVIKLLLMGAGFALSFALVDPLHVPGLFAGFILVHGAGMVALAISAAR